MLFVQHFLSVDFAFCTYSQDLLFWSKNKRCQCSLRVRACAYVYGVGVHIVENKLENISTYPSFCLQK